MKTGTTLAELYVLVKKTQRDGTDGVRGVMCDFTMLLPPCLLLLGIARTRSFEVGQTGMYTRPTLPPRRTSSVPASFGRWRLDDPNNHSETTARQPKMKKPKAKTFLQYLPILSIDIVSALTTLHFPASAEI